MPHTHHILPDLNLVYMQYSGHVTLDDQRSMLAEVMADPLHRFEMAKFCHADGITGTDLDLSSFMSLRDRLSAVYEELGIQVPWSVFAPGDLEFGMVRMFQTMVSDIPAIRMEVFRDLSAALSFLGLAGTDAAARLGLDRRPVPERTGS